MRSAFCQNIHRNTLITLESCVTGQIGQERKKSVGQPTVAFGQFRFEDSLVFARFSCRHKRSHSTRNKKLRALRSSAPMHELLLQGLHNSQLVLLSPQSCLLLLLMTLQRPPAEFTAPQRPMVVSTTMRPPLPMMLSLTPSTPATPQNAAEKVFFKVSGILPGWQQIFVLEHPAAINENKNCFKHSVNKNQQIAEGIPALNPCIERNLPRTGKKRVLIQGLVGHRFTHLNKFESDFEGTHQKFETEWHHGSERCQCSWLLLEMEFIISFDLGRITFAFLLASTS
jgi:hypothetical protein